MRALAIGTLLAWAGPASAARTVTISFDADRTQVAVGETVTWTVAVSWVADEFPDDAALGGFGGDLIANDPALGQASSLASLLPHVGSTPTVSGASVLGVDVFQSLLLKGVLDASNPIAVYRFDVITSERGVLRYGVLGDVTLPDFDFADPPGVFDLASVSDRVVIVPAPAVAASVAMGFLLTPRRRR
ncbi:MAG: hypothetical protein H6810_08175 [Phycisphaeraceae bacterium]|nr:MAG: hypothetical protein H6810_08175 [Phycisphaeraceae bacterium]